jgi:hypothetical protein
VAGSIKNNKSIVWGTVMNRAFLLSTKKNKKIFQKSTNFSKYMIE